jgi:hypothetical protein
VVAWRGVHAAYSRVAHEHSLATWSGLPPRSVKGIHGRRDNLAPQRGQPFSPAKIIGTCRFVHVETNGGEDCATFFVGYLNNASCLVRVLKRMRERRPRFCRFIAVRCKQQPSTLQPVSILP